MSESVLLRSTTLANGDRVPLALAASNYGLLMGLYERPDSEWDLLYYLREVCLGRDIDPEPLEALARKRLVGSDGVPTEEMRAVVLSAVRGEGRQLHLDSPFTDRLDRAVAQFLDARSYLHSFVDPPALYEVLDDPVMRALKSGPAKGPKLWTDLADDRTDPPGDLPPR